MLLLQRPVCRMNWKRMVPSQKAYIFDHLSNVPYLTSHTPYIFEYAHLIVWDLDLPWLLLPKPCGTRITRQHSPRCSGSIIITNFPFERKWIITLFLWRLILTTIVIFTFMFMICRYSSLLLFVINAWRIIVHKSKCGSITSRCIVTTKCQRCMITFNPQLSLSFTDTSFLTLGFLFHFPYWLLIGQVLRVEQFLVRHSIDCVGRVSILMEVFHTDGVWIFVGQIFMRNWLNRAIKKSPNLEIFQWWFRHFFMCILSNLFALTEMGCTALFARGVYAKSPEI